jgi:hypothetical protein
MKHLFFVIITLIVFSLHSKAQVSFSCYYREICEWNNEEKTFDNCKGYEESSLFVMNKSETMFTHTTEDNKSTYYVDKKTYDEKSNVWIYTVTSDIGNKYLFVFDPKNKEIRALVLDSDMNQVLMIRFYVKMIF